MTTKERTRPKTLSSPFEKSTYERNAKIYRVLANPIRLEILNILKQSEARVEELADLLGLRIANVSQHLAVLRDARAVVVRREGVRSYYSIADPAIVEPCRIFRDLWKKHR